MDKSDKEILYKYYSDESKYAISNLKKNLITFTPVESLNDPFEGYGYYSINLSKEEEKYWDSINAKDTPGYISNDIIERYKEVIDFNYRVFSLTKTYDNPLLWAHYANSHKGFCVGYNKNSILSTDSRLNFGNILYQEQLFNIEDINSEDELYKILLVKSRHWKYEKEWRAIYKINQNDVIERNVDCYTCKNFNCNEDIAILNPNHLGTLISPKYINRQCQPSVIYLGILTNSSIREELITMAKEKKIPVYQIIQKKNTFDFDIKDVYKI